MSPKMTMLLNEVGSLLSNDVGYPLDGTFLYSEAGRQWVSMSTFKDMGDHLLFRDPVEGLSDALLDLWEAAPAGKRWRTLQYLIVGDTFDARFSYEPVDREESSIDRRKVILQRRYGNKKIVYPPPPGFHGEFWWKEAP